jgi:2-(1,2-epoxy-1,2-dihydrophenyl)acetyl-CoA isomerase
MHVTDDEGIRYLRFDSPEQRNPFSIEIANRMEAAISDCNPNEHDAIVITGEGEAFSAGGDLNSDTVSDANEEARDAYQRFSGASGFVTAMLTAPVPTVAKVNGDAFGGGMSIVALSDFAYAVTDATFAASFVQLGLIPDGGATLLLQRHIGLRDALELVMTGRSVSATEATELGLVNDSVEDQAALEEAVEETLDRFRELPTGAVAHTRQALHENASRHYREGVDYENLLQAQATGTEDHRSAVEQFLNME